MKRIVLLLIVLLTINNVNAQEVYEWYQDGVLIFQLKPESKFQIRSNDFDVNIEEVSFLQEMRLKYDIEKISRILYYHPDEKLRNTFQIDFNNFTLIDEFVKDIDKYSFVEYAEKKELHVSFLTPNDLGANSTSGTGMWHLYTMQAELAWNLSTGSSNVVVAVTDDAIKTTHPDLTGKFVAGNDASDQNSTDPNPCGGNDGNHGTHVSGTIGANTNNGTGVASIGYDVSIMPVKIGRCSDGALTAGYEGLAWAANNGADVINMSWGGGGSSTFGQNAATAAFNQGAILVAAAGNDGVTSELYPAAYNNVIAVASTTTTDARSSFSQYGTWIDISAPGSAIRSTVATGNTYDRYNGTSMASPNVSGLLGLMKSYAPNASRTDLINCLYSSADPVTSNAGQMGAGRINAFAALNCVSAFTLQTDAGITDISSPSSTICGTTFIPSITLRNFGSNTITNLVINYTWGVINNNFNWTGNLASGQSVVVTLPVQTSGSSGSFTFTATANLSGDQLASNNSDSKAFTIDPNGQIATLTLNTDCYGSETTWEILDNLNNVIVSGGPYTNVTGGEVITASNCLPVGCYTFVINDSYGDGLHGSQWNTCAVDGDYSMSSGGSNLFQMTAIDGDFGNTTSHSFCIVDPSVNDDAGISEIVFPTSILCVGTFAPQVRIRNFGNNVLNSATINYNVGGVNQSFNWTGSLSTGQTAVVTLPNVTVSTGFTTLTAATINPNGNADQNNGNNQSQASFNVFSSSLNLPFTESFSTNSFTNGTWSLSNPDNDKTWELVTVSGTTPGTTGAKMDFFNYAQSAQRDGLISPSLNFNGYTSITMTFEHAYRRFNQTTTDSLLVYVSTNCGSSWQKVFAAGEDATGSFATASTNTNAFNPANSGEWCLGTVGADCFSVDLTAFSGNEVLVKFEGYNSGTVGNNLYLDNINITGVGAPVVADFSASTQNICEGAAITFNDLSSGVVNSRSWSFPGGSPASSTATTPSVTYNTAGTYNVSYTVTGPSGTDTETKTSHITVSAAPTASITGSNTFCSNGFSVLNANASTSGGTITSYQWFQNGTPVGSGTSTYNATQTGNYTVTVINSNACSFTSPIFTLTAAASPTVVISGDNTFCQGSMTTLTAAASTPTGSITTYAWQNGSTPIAGNNSPTLSVNQAGNYSVTVTNSVGCVATSNVIVVTGPVALPTPTISGSNIICPGSSTLLTATANPGSGTSVSSYQWFRNGAVVGGNSGTYSATQGGNYTVIVTNSAGCVGTSPILAISEATPFTVVINTTGAGCGVSDGGASVTVNGSTSNLYSYAWNNTPASSNTSISNLSAGIYELIVTENASGCSQTESFQILNAGAPVVDSVDVVQATCSNGNVGSASLYVSGGSGSYTYNWGTGLPDSSSQSNLSPGTYLIEITDAASCQATYSLTINNPTPPVVDTAIVTLATCLGINNGAIDLQVSGGSGNYTYAWSTGSASQDLFNISSGSYSVTVTDQITSCESTTVVNVGSTYTLGNNLTVVDNSANQGASSINAAAFGGIPPYNYSWNNGALTGSFIDNLSGGEYVLALTDDNGCLAYDTASIGFVGIKGIDEINLVKLFPNPTQNSLQLELTLTSSEDVVVTLINVLGQTIWAQELKSYTNGRTNIPTENLAAGTYFVRIQVNRSIEMLPFNKLN